MKITLKNNVVAEVTKGTTVFSLAENISPSLAKNALCGRVNGVLVDLNQTINKNCKLELITKSSDEAKSLINHTASHILAQAVKSVYPSCKVVSGDGDQNGFYYDFDFKTDITQEALSTIEDEINRIINANFILEKTAIPRYEAIIRMSEIEESYKIESLELGASEDVNILNSGDFFDLCDNAHLKSTGLIKKVILTKLSFVNSSGDYIDDTQFTRIEGVAFFSEKDYKEYQEQKERSKYTDHKIIGKNQEMFLLNDYGAVFWLPNGLKVKKAITDFWHELHQANDYLEISSPLIGASNVYSSKTYQEYIKIKDYKVMHIAGEDENKVIKSVNCPSAMEYFKLKDRTENDFPLRVSECTQLHREIDKDKLNGLFNLSEFTQDDAHNFITEEQIESEFNHLFDLIDVFYNTLNLPYSVSLATRPAKFIGERKVWNESEELLKQILTTRFGEGNFGISKGTGSYFGPKINILVQDSSLNSWVTGTLQLDKQLPKKYNLKYTSATGEVKTPVVIHRTICGSIERLIGLLLENCGGEFPFWLSPVQVKVIYQNKRNIKVVEKIKSALTAIKVRSVVEYTKSDLNAIVEKDENAVDKIPYIIYIDSTLVKEQSVLVLPRGETSSAKVPIKNFLEGLDELNKAKLNNLYLKF